MSVRLTASSSTSRSKNLAKATRRFRAVAAITHSPESLRPGSSFKAEIVIGRKQVYRIILEQ